MPDQIHLHCTNFAAGRCRSCSRLALPPDSRFAGKFAAFHSLALRNTPTAALRPLWIPDSVFPSRTKAKMSVTGTVEAPCIGILDSALQGQELLDCPLHLPLINHALTVVSELIPAFKLYPYDIASRSGELKSLILKASHDGESLMLRFVLRSTEAIPRIRKAAVKLQQSIPQLCSISANLQPIPHAILEGEQEIPIAGPGILWEQYGDVTLAFAPQSFSQVTPETAVALYRYVTELVIEAGARRLLDLYCGVGGFSIHAARTVPEVTGVELSSQAIECAKLAANRNSLPEIQFYATSTDSFLEQLQLPPDTVICNPPRRGLSAATVAQLTRLTPKRIVYSSCNPETLFRDLHALSLYKVTSLAPFEMFPLTEHLEVVACLDLL